MGRWTSRRWRRGSSASSSVSPWRAASGPASCSRTSRTRRRWSSTGRSAERGRTPTTCCGTSTGERVECQSACGSSSAVVSFASGSGTGDSSSSSLRSSSRGCVSSSAMKVVLPDDSELELEDGATGLDAAAAIGPKLAEQAVLVRSNGSVQDLRLPLGDGQHIQILTTRDANDPDALFVLRHSSAHLLAEAVRRLYPGVKIAIGPPIENGFYYDFDFPEPVHESDLERIEEEVRRELKEGREWTREETTSDKARERFLAEEEPYKVELVDTAEGPISLYTQGDFTDLCRGPHLQDSKPIKAFKLTGLAGAYWRGDEHNKQLTRIYGTAFYSQEDLDAHLARLEEARKRDHRRLGAQLDLFHLDDVSPGSPFWHPKGMVIWNALEDLRRRENRRRGYLEVKTPLLYEEALARHGFEYAIGQGEGTFYGPKIDLHMTDSLGRSWQMGTIQLDYQMPIQFGLTYTGADNAEHSPVVIHRALFGALERFIGIITEHYGGAFPVWIAPVQVRLIPVGEDHREAVHALGEKLEGVRVDVDERDETVGKRIRDAEVEKVPYVVVYGDKESDESLAVRKRGGEQITLSLDALRAEISERA